MNVHFHTGDDKYVPAIRRYDHRIGIFPEARKEVLLDWYRTQTDTHSRREAERLAKELVEYWLTEAESRRRDHRFLAAIGAVREALRIDPAQATQQKLSEAVAAQAKLDTDLVEALHQMNDGRLTDAIDTLNQILQIKPDWAVVHGKLGTLYAMTGQRERAIEHWQAVAKYDPNDPYGFNMLGWQAYLEGRSRDAVESFRRADEIGPFDAGINYRFGLALLKLGELPEAGDRFRRTVVIDPNHAGGCQGLSDALRRQGRAAEAVRYALRAARLTEFKNPDVLITLAEAYSAAGRLAEAHETGARALGAAQANSPAMVPQIRRRMEEWRRAEQTQQ
jgi:tetratricopeptide (TPR) repeat protein